MIKSLRLKSVEEASEASILVLAFGACLLCALLVNISGFQPVPTSAVIAVLASALGNRCNAPGGYSLAVYAGTFAGMGKVSASGSIVLSLLALSLIVAAVVFSFHRMTRTQPKLALKGLGGRLGFFGFIGFTMFSVLILHRLPTYHTALFNVATLVVSLAAIFAGAAATTIVRRTFGRDTAHDNVLASALIGAVGSLALMTRHEYCQTFAAGVFLGSFIAMSDLSCLRPRFLLLSGVIAALLLVLANMLFAGFGGLLGTVAVCSVAASRCIEAACLRPQNSIDKDSGSLKLASP